MEPARIMAPETPFICCSYLKPPAVISRNGRKGTERLWHLVSHTWRMTSQKFEGVAQGGAEILAGTKEDKYTNPHEVSSGHRLGSGAQACQHG